MIVFKVDDIDWQEQDGNQVEYVQPFCVAPG